MKTNLVDLERILLKEAQTKLDLKADNLNQHA